MLTGFTTGSNYNHDADLGDYNLAISVDDGHGGVDAGSVAVSLTNENDVPDFVEETSGLDDDAYVFSAPEGTTAGSVIGTTLNR